VAIQDDIARLLDELVRLEALKVRMRSESQADAILELNRAKFGQSRIAELLGTTPGTVGVTLARSKRKTKKTTEKET
jgi:DNA-directed RNA polymerase specialized sigma24 family protein